MEISTVRTGHGRILDHGNWRIDVADDVVVLRVYSHGIDFAHIVRAHRLLAALRHDVIGAAGTGDHQGAQTHNEGITTRQTLAF